MSHFSLLRRAEAEGKQPGGIDSWARDLPQLWLPSGFVLGHGRAEPSGSPSWVPPPAHKTVQAQCCDLIFPLVVVMDCTMTPTPWGTFPLMNVAVISET